MNWDGRAIGAWSGLSGVAHHRRAADRRLPDLGRSWRWIFYINVPIAAAVVAPGARHVPESCDRSVTGKIDYAGALAAVVFLILQRHFVIRRCGGRGRGTATAR